MYYIYDVLYIRCIIYTMYYIYDVLYTQRRAMSLRGLREINRGGLRKINRGGLREINRARHGLFFRLIFTY